MITRKFSNMASRLQPEIQLYFMQKDDTYLAKLRIKVVRFPQIDLLLGGHMFLHTRIFPLWHN